MKIVIAGCGWLGTPLAENLRLAGHQVAGTRRSAKRDQPLFPVYRFDPLKEASREVKTAFQQADWIVIAFTPDRERPEGYAENCLLVAELAGESTKILLVSSTGVYSDELIIATEEDVDYSQNHRIILAEKTLREYFGNRLTIIRMAGLFGSDRVIVNHLSVSGKTYNGNEPVNLIHQLDAAGICQFVIEKNITGEVINACSANHPLKKEFYTVLAEKLGLAAPLFENGPTGKIISPEKSRDLGYKYIKDDPFTFLD